MAVDHSIQANPANADDLEAWLTDLYDVARANRSCSI